MEAKTSSENSVSLSIHQTKICWVIDGKGNLIIENRDNRGNHWKVVQDVTCVRCSHSLCSTTDRIINEWYHLKWESCEKKICFLQIFFLSWVTLRNAIFKSENQQQTTYEKITNTFCSRHCGKSKFCNDRWLIWLLRLPEYSCKYRCASCKCKSALKFE
jgi:hypothetical protein